ncbi:unnamed protein product [Symbiodinium sp. CCMP2456]|nr:unnamed protein product [Symbiodinium sp. CCMP2456]
MQVVDACDLNDPQAQYIQDIVMNFAAGNATAAAPAICCRIYGFPPLLISGLEQHGVKAATNTFSLALSAQAIVKSERFSSLDDALKSRLFVKLASMGLLKT